MMAIDKRWFSPAPEATDDEGGGDGATARTATATHGLEMNRILESAARGGESRTLWVTHGAPTLSVCASWHLIPVIQGKIREMGVPGRARKGERSGRRRQGEGRVMPDHRSRRPGVCRDCRDFREL